MSFFHHLLSKFGRNSGFSEYEVDGVAREGGQGDVYATDEILRYLAERSGPVGAFAIQFDKSIEASFEREQAELVSWVEQAPPEILPTIIDVVINASQGPRNEETWRFEFEMGEMLEEWYRQRPEGWMAQMIRLLDEKQTRLLGLCIIKDVDCSEALPQVAAIVESAQSLTLEEREALEGVLKFSEVDWGQRLLERLREIAPREEPVGKRKPTLPKFE